MQWFTTLHDALLARKGSKMAKIGISIPKMACFLWEKSEKFRKLCKKSIKTFSFTYWDRIMMNRVNYRRFVICSGQFFSLPHFQTPIYSHTKGEIAKKYPLLKGLSKIFASIKKFSFFGKWKFKLLWVQKSNSLLGHIFVNFDPLSRTGWVIKVVSRDFVGTKMGH